MTTPRCHAGSMSEDHQETFERIKDVRAKALHHTRLAQQYAAERRVLMQGLIDQGVTQSDIARELGVSRQAIQKMLAC